MRCVLYGPAPKHCFLISVARQTGRGQPAARRAVRLCAGGPGSPAGRPRRTPPHPTRRLLRRMARPGRHDTATRAKRRTASRPEQAATSTTWRPRSRWSSPESDSSPTITEKLPLPPSPEALAAGGAGRRWRSSYSPVTSRLEHWRVRDGVIDEFRAAADESVTVNTS